MGVSDEVTVFGGNVAPWSSGGQWEHLGAGTRTAVNLIGHTCLCKVCKLIWTFNFFSFSRKDSLPSIHRPPPPQMYPLRAKVLSDYLKRASRLTS